MDQAKHYLVRYQQADTIYQKQAIVAEYQEFLDTLTATERDKAREVMSVLWPGIQKRVNELEPMIQTLEAMVNQIVPQQVQT